MKKHPDIHWLSQEDYEHAVGQFRVAVIAVLGVFSKYGQGDYIPPATFEIVRLAEDFALRCRGVEKIISLESIRRHQFRIY